MLVSGIEKNHAKFFFTNIHKYLGYNRFTMSIKSSMIDAYYRFPPGYIWYKKERQKMFKELLFSNSKLSL